MMLRTAVLTVTAAITAVAAVVAAMPTWCLGFRQSRRVLGEQKACRGGWRLRLCSLCSARLRLLLELLDLVSYTPGSTRKP